MKLDLSALGLDRPEIVRNATPARLVEEAIRFDAGSLLTAEGALVAFSGKKTGRSPKDKRIVREASSEKDVNWGDVNMAIEPQDFERTKKSAVEALNQCSRLYIFDGFAGWDPANRIKVRVICARPYHALFMNNMLIRPTSEELAQFNEPDAVILNAGQFGETRICLSFERSEMVIMGTDYAGEMKKGVFTLMNYLLPKKEIVSLHCSVNESETGESSIFLGLSGTGKTTLSADPKRKLIGDDEHYWTNAGLFNIEGGCYAKCAGLTREGEPEIFDAIRFGALLENVGVDRITRKVDYSDLSITENTRASYPIEHIPNAKIPCRTGHAKNVIFLTADAFGVLPPIARLTPEQAMYHFISGYTAKVAGTEVGVKEPQATFSACFGAPFMVWHPSKYAELLAARIREHGCSVWLVNTGWTGGPYGTGSRMKLSYTRAMIDAIHSGDLRDIPLDEDKRFGFGIPREVPGVPSQILNPRNTWTDKAAYDQAAKKLAGLFQENFKKYSAGCSQAVFQAGPRTE